ADGQVVWLRDIVRIVERQGDRVIMAGLMLDITEQKQAEEALLKAKQEAEEMARLKSAFLTNMSHEIRTPLAGILGFAEIIADEAGGEVREYAEIIGQSGKRLKETLNSVLDLARLESGSMQLAPEYFDVVQQIQQLLPIFERQTRDQKLYLRLEPATPQLFARLDKGAFSRILTNLISNGIKFTQKGGVTIRMGKGTGHIWIEVVDTGIGISDTFRDRLFDEFQQESVGLTRSYEGTGLGLSIAKRLVERMQGTIEVESQKDIGTTFTVRLPSADRVEEMKD
ncbi:MAG TPA: HAMP domain-containing sensor histidine kinase, partial [Rhodothermales bacterium]|nr:HAMP domain-containing sensor histidine kinase [Rhodothermales bacterium]